MSTSARLDYMIFAQGSPSSRKKLCCFLEQFDPTWILLISTPIRNASTLWLEFVWSRVHFRPRPLASPGALHGSLRDHRRLLPNPRTLPFPVRSPTLQQLGLTPGSSREIGLRVSRAAASRLESNRRRRAGSTSRSRRKSVPAVTTSRPVNDSCWRWLGPC